MIIKSATPEDLQTILTWVTTPQQLKFWGGPALTFPPLPERIWQEIGATSQNTFTLFDSQGNVVGFGQTLFRVPGTVHLGRIILCPAMRGKGLGRILCEQLIQAATIRYHPAEFTLSVYKDNSPAVRLYTALGFNVLSENLERNSYLMGLRVMDPVSDTESQPHP